MVTKARVFLCSVDDPDWNVLISRGIPYEAIVKEAYRRLDHSPDVDDVHFHVSRKDFQDGRCRGRISPDLWTEPEYMSDEVNEEGELMIWAHFVIRLQRRGSPDIDTISNAESVDIMQASHRGEDVHEDNMPDNDQPPRLRKSSKPQKQKTHHQSRRGAIPRGPGSRKSVKGNNSMNGRRGKAFPKHVKNVHGDLPLNLTVDKYIIDFEKARDDNTRDRFKTSDTHITQMNKESRRIIALARLIWGDYGVTASTACDRCSREKTPCKIFHPILYTKKWYEINKHWQIEKYGRRACACCFVRSDIRQFCNARLVRHTK